MRTQTFGVEVEMAGIRRKGAAQVAADFFESTAEYIGGGYNKSRYHAVNLHTVFTKGTFQKIKTFCEQLSRTACFP